MFKPVTYTMTIECEKCNEKLTLNLDIREYETEDYDCNIVSEFDFHYEPEKFGWGVLHKEIRDPAFRTYRCPNHKNKKKA